MKTVLIASLLLLTVSWLPQATYAYDPSVSNNKYGIGLAQPTEEDLKKAADLVNSNGGDWGYVTLVMQENDRDHAKWQQIFDTMRKLHLIPIIRLATQPAGSVWKRPSKGNATEWVNFLNSLNWVIKDRYVILFNEPNHAAEWGGEVDPADYAAVALEFATKLKSGNQDFYIMLAGFDASAPSAPPTYQDEQIFLQSVFTRETIDQWNSVLSGWSSHSYPNPAFAGSPTDVGRGTIRNYQWELDLLKQLGVKDLPVFITETGWDASLLGQDVVAEYTKTAFEQVWFPDSRVVATTPFLLNYQGEPFIKFSWATTGNNGFHPVYYKVQDLLKTSGRPEVIEKGALRGELPDELVTGSIYRFPVTLRNTGQSIWNGKEGYSIKIEGANPIFYYASDLGAVSPYQDTQVYIYAQTIDDTTGRKSFKIVLYKDDKKVEDLRSWNPEILPLPSLTFKVRLFPAFLIDSSEYEVQIFDDQEQMVYKKINVGVIASEGILQGVPNVVIGKRYRVVLLRPYFLPRQTYVVFNKGKNKLTFPWMLPVDMNNDGKLDAKDLFGEVEQRR